MGNIDVVVELLRLGCDVNAVTSRGETALHYAVRCGQPHVAALILDAAEDVNVDATTLHVSLSPSSTCAKNPLDTHVTPVASPHRRGSCQLVKDLCAIHGQHR